MAYIHEYFGILFILGYRRWLFDEPTSMQNFPQKKKLIARAAAYVGSMLHENHPVATYETVIKYIQPSFKYVIENNICSYLVRLAIYAVQLSSQQDKTLKFYLSSIMTTLRRNWYKTASYLYVMLSFQDTRKQLRPQIPDMIKSSSCLITPWIFFERSMA